MDEKSTTAPFYHALRSSARAEDQLACLQEALELPDEIVFM
jgi:hypothetical protein